MKRALMVAADALAVLRRCHRPGVMRTRHRARLTVVLAIAVATSACSRAMPAGFWATYQKGLIVNSNSDQGPWGGSRWIQWVGKEGNTFTPAGAAAFATEHGWKCDAPVELSSEQVTTWVSYAEKRPVFPLFFENNDAGNSRFPRHIEGDCTITRCETGWVRIAPGTGKDSPAFGYIQVSRDGARMAVYHLWGEV